MMVGIDLTDVIYLYRNEVAGESYFPFISAFDIHIAKTAEDNCPDKIDKQVLHRIDDTNIEIPAFYRICFSIPHKHFRGFYIFQNNGNVESFRIQIHRRNAVNKRIFLHVHT